MNNDREHTNTDPAPCSLETAQQHAALERQLASLKGDHLMLARQVRQALEDILTPGVVPSDKWINAQSVEDQLATLRFASAAALRMENTGQAVPPAPEVLRQWAGEQVPRVELVYPFGDGGLGEQAEDMLATLKEQLDHWYRRVVLNAGSLEDGQGPFPSFKAEVYFAGYSDDNEPLIGASVETGVFEVL